MSSCTLPERLFCPKMRRKPYLDINPSMAWYGRTNTAKVTAFNVTRSASQPHWQITENVRTCLDKNSAMSG